MSTRASSVTMVTASMEQFIENEYPVTFIAVAKAARKELPHNHYYALLIEQHDYEKGSVALDIKRGKYMFGLYKNTKDDYINITKNFKELNDRELSKYGTTIIIEANFPKGPRILKKDKRLYYFRLIK